MDVGTGTNPPSAPWQLLVGAGTGSFYQIKNPKSALVTGSGYVPGTAVSIYDALASGSHYPSMDWVETSVYGNLTGYDFTGQSVIRGTKRLVFSGDLTVNMPGVSDGAGLGWQGPDVEVMIAKHGTIAGTVAPSVEVVSQDAGSFTVRTNSLLPVQVQITAIGTKMWPS